MPSEPLRRPARAGRPAGRRPSSAAVARLTDAFRAFSATGDLLQASYASLQDQVAALAGELEEANRRLSASVEERERMRCMLENVLQSMPSGVLVVNREERILLANHAAESLTGRRAADVTGRMIRPLFGPGTQIIEAALRGQPGEGETRLLTASGWRDVEVSATPIRDGAGQVHGALVVFGDLAERRRAEEMRERGNTFAALGEMSITIAHEIRNPLGAVELFASLLHEELRDDPRREELAGSIIHGVHTLNAIVSNLLFFARPMTPLFQPLDLHQVLDEALGFAVHAVRQKEIALIKALASGDLPIQGDREQLKQVFLNLFLNAVQAMGPGGRLVVQTRRRAGAAEVSLSDTGPGIPADVLPRIFDPFFTTKPKGTGLGLAIAQRILDQHKAGIRVVTRMGKGTTFILSFFDGRRAQRSDAR